MALSIQKRPDGVITREIVDKRSQLILFGACFGGAFLLIGGAIASAVNDSVKLPQAGILALSGALMFAIGVIARQIVGEKEQKLKDETEREHELAIELEQQRHAIDTLAEGLSIAILICDPRARILYANGRTSELFRFENPVGRTVLDVTLSYDLEKLFLSAMATKGRASGEFTITYPEERQILADCWPDEGTNRGFVALSDITSLRKLERIRRDFVANVSHELRTPLSTIRAMAETLHDEDQPDPGLEKRFLDKIISEVDRLSLITQDLLSLSLAESNPVWTQECDISEVFRTVASQFAQKAKGKGLEINYEGTSNLMVQANPSQMTQVAINLIDNAINYTTEGSVTVKVEDCGPAAEISVSDTGIGIPSEHLPRIFERFYRVDKGRSRATGGTGLGLSIVKHIVDAHGGAIEVESDLGKGTTFRIRLAKSDAASGAHSNLDSES